MRPSISSTMQKMLADASFRTVVTPNVDTVYSQAWLDISTEPMVYVLPETDRFCNVQLLDAWTNTAAVLDKAGAYAIALPGWEGELPDGVTRVDVPTATMWSITRTVLSGNEDLPNVYAIQDRMALLPLSAYEAGSYTAPTGSYDPANEFVPVQHVLAMSPQGNFLPLPMRRWRRTRPLRKMRRCSGSFPPPCRGPR